MELVKWILIILGVWLLFCLLFCKRKCGCHGDEKSSTSGMNVGPASSPDPTASAEYPTQKTPGGQCVTRVSCG